MPIRAKNTNERENDTHERANDGHMPKKWTTFTHLVPNTLGLENCSEADHITIKSVNFGSYFSILKVNLQFLLYV